jgi:plastocyanin
MHPTDVASAAWVIAAAPSKVPFYVAGGVLACWAVGLTLVGVTHPRFPSSAGRARLIMAASAVLVATTAALAVATASHETSAAAGEGGGAGAAGGTTSAGSTGGGAPSRTLQIAADPSGQLRFDVKTATAASGRVTIDFTNRSPVPHNVTIARAGKVVAATKTITSSTARTTANLPAGGYVFYCSVDAHRQAGMQGTLTAR